MRVPSTYVKEKRRLKQDSSSLSLATHCMSASSMARKPAVLKLEACLIEREREIMQGESMYYLCTRQAPDADILYPD